MLEQLVDRRKDLVLRQSIEKVLSRYEKQTGESSAEICTQPRRLYESLLLEMLGLVNGSYGCVLRLTGVELAETPFLELITSIGRVHGGRLVRQYDTLLNRKPDSLVETVLHTGNGMFANNKRSMVPVCLPDCRPSIDNFVVLPLTIGRQSPFIIFLANSDKPFNYGIVENLEKMLAVFSRFHKSFESSKDTHDKLLRYQRGVRQRSVLLDACFNGVLTFNCSAEITEFNPACEKYFEVVSKVAIGTSVREFLSAEIIDKLVDEANRIPSQVQLRNQTPIRVGESVGYRSDPAKNTNQSRTGGYFATHC